MNYLRQIIITVVVLLLLVVVIRVQITINELNETKKEKQEMHDEPMAQLWGTRKMYEEKFGRRGANV